MLTHAQKDCLEFISAYIHKHRGIAPSYTDICEAMGLASKSGVNRLLNALEERGHIRRLANRSRAIEVVHKPERRMYFVWDDEMKRFVLFQPLRKAVGQG